MALLAVVGASTFPIAGVEAQPPPYTVTVAPTTELADGSRLTITLTTDPANPIITAEAQVCRAGVAYQSSAGSRPAPDFAVGGPNCPKDPITTSASTVAVARNALKFATTPEGETFSLQVGVGNTSWNAQDGTPYALTCDQDNPCVLVVQVRYVPEGGKAIWRPTVVELDYANPDTVAACGGAAPGVLRSGGSDALSETWVGWTQATCNTQGTTGAWTQMTFGEESNAVERFARGELDIAYTGVGYEPEAGFASDTKVPGGPRPTVAVPVAVNASVVALGNGYADGDGRKRPYGTQAVTLEELAVLLSGGEWAIDPYRAAIETRNPQLGEGGGIFAENAKAVKVGGPSEGGTTAFLVTRHLDRLVPDHWKVPDSPSIPGGGVPGTPRGVHPSLALADPTFAGSVGLLTGRPGVAKVFAVDLSEVGGEWIVTDLSTARALGLSPVAIEQPAAPSTAAGREPASSTVFVAPTRASMHEAVASMATRPTGLRVADPATTAGYPLTYVVYALVPAEPLVDAAGSCRTESQDLLARWMTHLVSDQGQASLPPGVEPLPEDLQAAAQAALADIGATPGEVSCEVPPPVPPAVPPSAAPTGGTGTAGAAAPVPGAGSAPRASGGAGTVSSGSPVEAAAPVAPAGEEEVLDEPAIPGFGGGMVPSAFVALAGLLGVMALPTLAARVTARREPGDGLSWLHGPEGGS